MASRKAGFVAVTGGYLAATTAESLLAPIFPLLAREFSLGTGAAGLAFGILAISIAGGGLSGGFFLARLGPRTGMILGLLLVAIGAAASAAADGRGSLLLAQVVLGFGSGAFFASGLRSIALLAGERRRGLAVAVFGVAFSGGLALAGALAALGGAWGWRASFLAGAGFAVLSAASIAPVRIGPRLTGPARATRIAGRGALVLPVKVGGVAAASQYGTVAFLPLFAVHSWGMSPAAAALVITVARVLSIPAKLVSGNAADGAGALRIARRLGLLLAALGAWWTIVPGPAAAVWAAVLFAAFVSGLGPVANVLALESFEERAQLLGAFRSVQIGLGAATAALLGVAAELVGLRLALAVAAVVIPASLLLVGRSAQARMRATSIPK